MSSAPSFGPYTPAYLQQQIVQSNNPASMQLVPYTQHAAKSKPLTADELQRLYNMPAYGPAPPCAGPSQPGFIPQPQYPINYSQFPPNYIPQAPSYAPQPVPSAITTYGFLPQPSVYTTTFANSAPAPVSNPESALVHVPKLTNPPPNLNTRPTTQLQQLPGPSNVKPNPSAVGLNTTNINTSTANEVVFRQKNDSTSKKLGDNLIDFGIEDNSRVSVLEAFDPLLCGNRSSSGSGGSDDDDDEENVDKGKTHVRQ